MSVMETPQGALYDVIDLKALRQAHRPLYQASSTLEADGNVAAAIATLQFWRCVIYAGFPITPSTKWLEFIAAKIASGKYGLKRVKLLEAEHAVADYLVGAAASCRDLIFTTATSSVGLDHMTETTRSLGASGLGNVMLINVYRSTANFPLCIEGDPSDTLAHRDDGWIQVVCRGKQQIYDTIIQLPCVGMHPEILTPTMPGYYGIKDSHRTSRLGVESDQKIHDFQDRWIKPCRWPGLINGDTAMGNCVTSKYFQGFKLDQKRRLDRVFDILPQVGLDFQKTFDRPGLSWFEKINWPKSGPIDLVVISMGPDMGTFESLVVEECHRTQKTIAGLAVSLLTPFPAAQYAAGLRDTRCVAVVNQGFHAGRGHLCVEVADALSSNKQMPVLSSFYTGLGGANVSTSSWQRIVDEALGDLQAGRCRHPWRFVHEGVVL